LGNPIGEIIFHAAGVAISPRGLIAIILILTNPRARINGLAFAFGWILALGLALTALIAIGAGSHAGHAGHPSHWAMWTRLVIGLALLGFAVRQLRGVRRHGADDAPPAWASRIEEFGPVRCAVLATVLALADPKNISQLLDGAIAIAVRSSDNGTRAAAGVVFVVLASACVLIPLTVHLVGGNTTTATLDRWKRWLVANNSTIMATMFVLLGTKSLGDGITGLTS